MAVNEARHNFFANTRLSRQQNRGVSDRNALRHRKHFPACLIDRNNTRSLFVSHQFVFIDMRQQGLGIKRLEEKIAST